MEHGFLPGEPFCNDAEARTGLWHAEGMVWMFFWEC